MTTPPVVYHYEPDDAVDEDLIRALFEPTLYWVYVGGRCVGTAEPVGDGRLRFYLLLLLWEGDDS